MNSGIWSIFSLKAEKHTSALMTETMSKLSGNT